MITESEMLPVIIGVKSVYHISWYTVQIAPSICCLPQVVREFFTSCPQKLYVILMFCQFFILIFFHRKNYKYF